MFVGSWSAENQPNGGLSEIFAFSPCLILSCEPCTVQGLTIIGDPEITCFAIGSNDPDVHILAVADVLESKGNAQMTLDVQAHL